MFDFTDYKLLAQAQNKEIQAWLKAHPTKRDYLYEFCKQGNTCSISIALLLMPKQKLQEYRELFEILKRNSKIFLDMLACNQQALADQQKPGVPNHDHD